MSLEHNEIDQMVTGYREDFCPDVELGLRRLHQRIGSVRQLPAAARRRRLYGLAAAAAVAFLIAATFLFSRDRLTYLENDGVPIATYSLPDGSRLLLQDGSAVSYDPQTYDRLERAVALTGQAYFEVVPDAARPFVVSNDQGSVRVTGTAFNLRSGARMLEVEVSEGTVVLESGGHAVPVAAREYGMVRAGEPMVHRPAPNLNHHAWRTGNLTFDNTPISEVLSYFQDNWGIECSWENDLLCDYPVSGSYSGADAGAVLADIATLGGYTLRQLDERGKKYEFKGHCNH